MRPIPVLLYHSVSADSSERFRTWTLHPDHFAAHLESLAAAGYRSLTISELCEIRSSGGALPERPVVITFDDGFADFHSAALPALEEHGFVATLYVASGFVGATAGWLAREGESQRPMLSWEQVEDAARRGVEIGAHSRRHPRLDEISRTEAEREIRGSRDDLEDRLQQPVTSFAYPHGYHGPRVRQQVREAGFASAAAVKHALSSDADDVLAVARLVVGNDTTVGGLHRLLAGDGVAVAPFPTPLRTNLWRVARRARRLVTHPRLPRAAA